MSFIFSAPLIIAYTHKHTHVYICVYKYKHNFIVSALSHLCGSLSFAFQSPLIITSFSVLIDSPFLVPVSREGCLEWDTGLALGAWFISLQYWLEPLFGSAGFAASGRE